MYLFKTSLKKSYYWLYTFFPVITFLYFLSSYSNIPIFSSSLCLFLALTLHVCSPLFLLLSNKPSFWLYGRWGKKKKKKPSNPSLISFLFWKLVFVELPGAAPVSPTAAKALFIGRGLKSNWPYSCTARPSLVLMLHNTRQCSDWGMRVIQWRGRQQQKSTEGVWIKSTGGNLKW